MPRDVKTFMVEDAHIIYPNFSGREGPFNKAGVRGFNVILDPKTAREMAKDGWNVKFPEPTDEGDARDPHINVRLRFDVHPPLVVMISSTSRTTLNEETVEVLDSVEFETVDLIANASNWDVNGKTGVKAYLKSMFVTIAEDALQRKYAIHDSEG